MTNNRLGSLGYGGLGLLATGDEKYVPIVKAYLAGRAKTIPDIRASLARGGKAAWAAGTQGILMAEYALLTGDRTFFDAMRDNAVRIAMGRDRHGLWGHGFAWTALNEGELNGSLPGYGAVNTSGVPCLIALILARKAGVRHSEIDAAITKASTYFRTYVHRGQIGYGFHPPTMGYDSNGKNSMAAVAYHLLGDRDATQYFALCAASCRKREGGHTGNYFNNTWGGLGANIGGPEAAKAYYTSREWYRTMVRSWDGSFRSQYKGGSPQNSYSNCSITGAYLLNLVSSRRVLYITGKENRLEDHLTVAQVAESNFAHKLDIKSASMSNLSNKALFGYLGSWSTDFRERAARELAGRSTKSPGMVPTIIEKLKSGDELAKSGALMACKEMTVKAKAAGPTLVKALAESKDHTFSKNLPAAITAVGETSKAALEVILRDALRTYPGELTSQRYSQLLIATRVITTGTARQLGTDPFVYLKKHNIDEALYLKALDHMMPKSSNVLGKAMANIKKYYSREQIYELTDSLIAGASVGVWERRPLEVLSDLGVEEALPRIWERIDTDVLGMDTRPLLPKYGVLVKDRIPKLKAIQAGNEKNKLTALIRQLESAKQAKTVRVHDYFVNKYSRLTSGMSESEKMKYLEREMENSMDIAYIRRSALLELMHRTNSAAAFDRIIDSLGPGRTHLGRTAQRLAGTYPWGKIRPLFKKNQESQVLAGLLLVTGSLKPPVSPSGFERYLKHDSDSLKKAAAQSLQKRGSSNQVTALIEALSTCSNYTTAKAIRKALLAIGEREKISESDLTLLMTTLTEQVSASDRSKMSVSLEPLGHVLGQLGRESLILKVRDRFAKEALKVGRHVRGGLPEMVAVRALTQGYLYRIVPESSGTWTFTGTESLKRNKELAWLAKNGHSNQIVTYFCLKQRSDQMPLAIRRPVVQWMQGLKDLSGASKALIQTMSKETP